jgi:hypothetical protein
MFGPVALLIVGIGAAVTRRPHPINLVVGTIGLVLLVIVLVDFPVACRFDARGVQRRCPLRRAMLDWDRIDRFTRAAPAVRFGRETSPSGSPSKKTPVRLRPAGLVASIGRRRYLLVNRCESGRARLRPLPDVDHQRARHVRHDRRHLDAQRPWRWLSDMFGGGGGAALGSTAAERNLNRITLVLALIWFFTVIALTFLLER